MDVKNKCKWAKDLSFVFLFEELSDMSIISKTQVLNTPYKLPRPHLFKCNTFINQSNLN